MAARIPTPTWIAQMLRAYGVTHVFFVPEVATHGIAAMEAEGVVRVTGRPTVVDVVTDPAAFPPKVWRSAPAPAPDVG